MSEKERASLPEARRVRQGLLDLLSLNDLSNQQIDAVVEAVALLGETENKLLQEEKPTVTISQLKKTYGVRQTKRGVASIRDEYICTYVELRKWLNEPKNSLTHIYEDASELAGFDDARTIQRIVKESAKQDWYPSFDHLKSAEGLPNQDTLEKLLDQVEKMLQALSQK